MIKGRWGDGITNPYLSSIIGEIKDTVNCENTLGTVMPKKDTLTLYRYLPKL